MDSTIDNIANDQALDLLRSRWRELASARARILEIARHQAIKNEPRLIFDLNALIERWNDLPLKVQQKIVGLVERSTAAPQRISGPRDAR